MSSIYHGALFGFLPPFAAGEVAAPDAAPTGFDVAVDGATGLTASWEAMSGVSGYEVEIRLTP